MQQFLVTLVDIDFHTKRNPSPLPSKKKGENTQIISIVSGIPGARAKQTTQINCFSDTKAHSIKANQITSLSGVLLNGLFGTLTASWAQAHSDYQKTLVSTLTGKERLSEERERKKKGRGESLRRSLWLLQDVRKQA